MGAGKALTAEIELFRTTGNLESDLGVTLVLAELQRFAGERAQAVQVLQRALEISVDGGAILYELSIRSALATMAADPGGTGEALPHLKRCRQIVGAGENWLGVAGSVERGGGRRCGARRVRGGGKQIRESDRDPPTLLFAVGGSRHLQYWGRALLASGERALAMEKFADAIEIYRSHGAGTRFVEYVMADKRRRQDSKSADASAKLH